jgi:uncharacterized membrane protein YfcA
MNDFIRIIFPIVLAIITIIQVLRLDKARENYLVEKRGFNREQYRGFWSRFVDGVFGVFVIGVYFYMFVPGVKASIDRIIGR